MIDLRDIIAAAACNWYFGETTAWEESAEAAQNDWLGCADAIIDQLLDLAGQGKLLAAINTIATPKGYKSYCIRCGIPHTEKCLRP